MPDLLGRAEHEQRMRAAIAAALAAWSESPRDYQRLRASLRDNTAGPLALVYLAAADGVGRQLRPESWSQPTAEANEWASRTAGAIAVSVASNTHDAIQRAEQAGGAEAVAAAIATLASDERAYTIAITETTRGASVGELDEVRRYERATGRQVVTAWVTEKDSLVCPICKPLDGVWRDTWQQYFPLGPPAHPRCRCYLRHEVL